MLIIEISLLDDRKEKQCYGKWEEEALDCARFGRGYGPVVRLRNEVVQLQDQ